jgi:hypothetical protein
MLSDPKGSTKAALLTGNPLAAVPPIVVYTGPKKPTGSGQAEADAAMLKQAKKHAKKSDKPGDKPKTGDAKTDKTDKIEAAKNTKPATPKTAQAKPQKPKVAPTTQ